MVHYFKGEHVELGRWGVFTVHVKDPSFFLCRVEGEGQWILGDSGFGTLKVKWVTGWLFRVYRG